jgi:hypothetical protein
VRVSDFGDEARCSALSCAAAFPIEPPYKYMCCSTLLPHPISAAQRICDAYNSEVTDEAAYRAQPRWGREHGDRQQQMVQMMQNKRCTFRRLKGKECNVAAEYRNHPRAAAP